MKLTKFLSGIFQKDTWKEIGNEFKQGWNNLKNSLNPIKDYAKTTLDTLSGKAEQEQATKAQDLAQQSQDFNEQYSTKQLQQQADQFAVTSNQAQQNIDWQKDIAEKNLAAQVDAFNAQLKENELTRLREDTAYQRQVADLKAAGFSPLMASNGANAASMSVGSAPQYDSSGVSTAQGSAIQLAQEYAQLRNMAQGQYLSRRQEAVNQRIAAMQVLGDISQKRRLGFENLALQSWNLANAIKDSKAKRALIDEQIESSKAARDWYGTYGYRRKDLWTEILPIIEKTANKLNINAETISNALSKLPETIKEALRKEPNKNELQIAMNLKDYEKALQEKFTAEDITQCLAYAVIGYDLSESEIQKVAGWLYPKMAENRRRNTSYERFIQMIKEDGLANVLSYTFGIRL